MMNWLKKQDKKKQIPTTVKASSEKELALRVKNLTDKGWTVLNTGTYEKEDSASFKVHHRGMKGAGKTSNIVVIQGSVTGYWCRLLSPVWKEKTA